MSSDRSMCAASAWETLVKDLRSHRDEHLDRQGDSPELRGKQGATRPL
jgi:hypothetical protein